MKWEWKSLSRVQLLRPHGLWPARLLCPWDFPGKNTGVGCHLRVAEIRILKSYLHPVLTGVLFTTAKRWKQPTCLSVDEWIKKMPHTHRMERYSAIRRRKSCYLWQHGWPGEHYGTWNVRERQTIDNLTYLWNLKKNNNSESKLVVARDGVLGGQL